MTAAIQTLLLLVAVLVVVAIVARRFNIAPPILLVIAGILFALAPGLPRIELAPELVLLGILPPLIYSAGVAMSWREFRFNLRPIALLAFGYVVFTTCAVAATAHWLLGMPLAVAFVRGAIVAPTDAVAPVSIMRQMGVPRRLVVILEGEGLANDATALILYRFAVAAAGTGLFSLGQAAGTFVLIVVGEIAFGIGIGWLSLRLRRWARDPRVEITLSLLTPYAAFLIPAHLGGSGVLSTMTAGLFASWNGPLVGASGGRSDCIHCGRPPTCVRDSHALDLEDRPACALTVLKQPLLRAHRAQILSASTAATSKSAESGQVQNSATAKKETQRAKCDPSDVVDTDFKREPRRGGL